MKPTRPVIARAYPLEDISIREDGRTVVAYAAMFGDSYEVTDEEGHYFEQVNRAAFNRAISHGIDRFACLFNHGLTIYRTPSDRFSVPLGTPVAVRAETKGLLTETQYAKTPLADEILELVRDGGIRGMSFRGPIFRQKRIGSHQGLPLRELLEVGLNDYGPCTFPMNPAAQVVAVRAVDDLTNNELNERLRRAVQDRFVEDDSDTWVYVDDFSVDEANLWLIYNLDGHYYRISYSVDNDGEVTLEGDPVEVEREVEWTEVSPSASTTEPAGTDTSERAASSSSLQLLELAQAQRHRREG